MDSTFLKRRQMLTYLGLGLASLGGTIACQAQKSESNHSSELAAASAQSPTSLAQAAADKTQLHLPEFQGIEQWINSSPLSINDLKGTIVLIQIWTFACINCQRTLPYIVRWHQQYAQKGLKVIGIHTPEFGYERDLGNVKSAVQKHGIVYPVAVDNRFQMWKAYKNEYWPHLFLADRQSVIRYNHIGEGNYDITEQTIRRLLG